MNKKFGIKEVVAIGIGTALFVVLTEVQIPIGIPNTSLQPRMAVLAFLSAIFGPFVGASLVCSATLLVTLSSTARYGGAGYSRRLLSALQSALLQRNLQ